jgi:LPS O-antigen subunit length determinant protein (WzzB/FepE family)
MELDTDMNNIKGICLRDVILEVWRGRLVLVAAILLAAALGFAFVLCVPHTKTARMTVMPISETEFLMYHELMAMRNSIDALAAKQGADRNAEQVGDRVEEHVGDRNAEQVGVLSADTGVPTLRKDPEPVFEFDKGYLLNILFEDLTHRETLKAALKNVMHSKVGELGENPGDAVTVESFNYRIIPPTRPEDVVNNRVKIVNPYWTIEYEGNQSDIVPRVVDEALAASTSNTAKVITQRFQQTVGALTRELDHMKRNVGADMDDLRHRYATNVRARVAFLAEQAQIARAIGAARATLNVQPLGETNQVLSVITSDPSDSYYLRGYVAIEQEIKEIQTRKITDDFIPDLQPLLSMSRAIDRNDLIERVTTAFNKTPLVEGNFVASNYNTNSIKIEYKSSPAVALIYFLLGGALLGLVFIYLRAIFRETPRA